MTVTQIETYNQNDYSRRFRKAHVESKGVCAAMSAMYLLMSSRGEDYWSWQRTRNGQGYVIGIHGRRKGPEQYMHEVLHGILDRMKYVGRIGPLHISKLPDWLVSTNLISDDGKRVGRGDFILFIWWCPDIFGSEAGHAMAVQRAPQKRFMDPDTGEWAYDSLADFSENWIGGYLLAKVGGVMRKIRSSTFELYFYDKKPSDTRQAPMPVGGRRPGLTTIRSIQRKRPGETY